MAVPEGRGYGGPEDDYYALGVLVLVLLCGGNPVPGLSEHDLVEAKISKGSYAAMVGETRLSMPMVEVLRGLLCDADRTSVVTGTCVSGRVDFGGRRHIKKK